MQRFWSIRRYENVDFKRQGDKDRGTVLSSPFPTDLKEKYIKKFHANSVSIRQISRLCGETEGLVEKYLR